MEFEWRTAGASDVPEQVFYEKGGTYHKGGIRYHKGYSMWIPWWLNASGKKVEEENLRDKDFDRARAHAEQGYTSPGDERRSYSRTTPDKSNWGWYESSEPNGAKLSFFGFAHGVSSAAFDDVHEAMEWVAQQLLARGEVLPAQWADTNLWEGLKQIPPPFYQGVFAPVDYDFNASVSDDYHNIKEELMPHTPNGAASQPPPNAPQPLPPAPVTTANLLLDAAKHASLIVGATKAEEIILTKIRSFLGEKYPDLLKHPMADEAIKLLVPIALHYVASTYPNYIPQAEKVQLACKYAIEGNLIRNMTALIEVGLPLMKELSDLGSSLAEGQNSFLLIGEKLPAPEEVRPRVKAPTLAL